MLRKHKKHTFSSIILWLSILLLFFLAIGYAALQQNLKISGKVSILSNNSSKDVTTSVDTTEKDGMYHHKVFVTVTNNQKYDMDGWNITMEIPKDSVLGNTEKIKASLRDSMTIILKSISENSYLAMGKSASFSFEIISSEPTYVPTNIKLNGLDVAAIVPEQSAKTILPDEIFITQECMDKWEKDSNFYCEYTVTLFNRGNVPVNSWEMTLLFSEEGSIEKMWNATILNSISKKYLVQSSEFNSIIEPNTSVTFSFIYSSSFNAITLSTTDFTVK